jgi:hypothetical protein
LGAELEILILVLVAWAPSIWKTHFPTAPAAAHIHRIVYTDLGAGRVRDM